MVYLSNLEHSRSRCHWIERTRWLLVLEAKAPVRSRRCIVVRRISRFVDGPATAAGCCCLEQTDWTRSMATEQSPISCSNRGQWRVSDHVPDWLSAMTESREARLASIRLIEKRPTVDRAAWSVRGTGPKDSWCLGHHSPIAVMHLFGQHQMKCCRSFDSPLRRCWSSCRQTDSFLFDQRSHRTKLRAH